MADSDQTAEKTEEGSEKRINDALEQGNVPLSREASVFASLAAMLAIVSLAFANNLRALADVLAQLFANPAKAVFATPADTVNVFGFATQAGANFLLPILIILMVSGLVASMGQGLPRFVLNRIAPKWSKLSPMAGLKRLFALDGLIEFLKSLLKLLIVSVVIAIVLNNDIRSVIETLYIEPSALGALTLGMISRLIAGSLVAYGVLTAADLVWSRFKWRRDLRMTKQEVKDEFKQAEGDPFFKAKRRSLALDRSRRRMIAAVPRATLVIANPTHYAIALRYVREEGGAPLVIAKGQDLIALKIREIAENNNIPIIEDKALARSMYDHVEVSQLIPTEFYKAVAELIHFLQSRGSRLSRSTVKA
jgi:flagellar biosynthetic protein FlhB